MRSSIIFAVTVAGAAAIAGCGARGGGSYKPQPVKNAGPTQVGQGSESSLFPLAVGNQWVYDVAGRVLNKKREVVNFTGEITWKVVKVQPAPDGGKRATIEVSTGGKVNDRQEWLVNNKGLFQISIGQKNPTVFSPPLPALLFPATKDRSFAWKGLGVRPNMSPGSSSTKSRILGPRDVDMTSGPALPSIAVETVSDFGKSIGTSVSTAFFVPNVGLARYVHQVRTKSPSELLLRLKSHRFPNVSK